MKKLHILFAILILIIIFIVSRSTNEGYEVDTMQQANMQQADIQQPDMGNYIVEIQPDKSTANLGGQQDQSTANLVGQPDLFKTKQYIPSYGYDAGSSIADTYTPGGKTVNNVDTTTLTVKDVSLIIKNIKNTIKLLKKEIKKYKKLPRDTKVNDDIYNSLMNVRNLIFFVGETVQRIVNYDGDLVVLDDIAANTDLTNYKVRIELLKYADTIKLINKELIKYKNQQKKNIKDNKLPFTTIILSGYDASQLIKYNKELQTNVDNFINS